MSKHQIFVAAIGGFSAALLVRAMVGVALLID